MHGRGAQECSQVSRPRPRTTHLCAHKHTACTHAHADPTRTQLCIHKHATRTLRPRVHTRRTHLCTYTHSKCNMHNSYARTHKHVCTHTQTPWARAHTHTLTSGLSRYAAEPCAWLGSWERNTRLGHAVFIVFCLRQGPTHLWMWSSSKWLFHIETVVLSPRSTRA